MSYKIVFSDVDGTLLDSEHRVLPGTLAAIRQLQMQGIPFVIISARSPAGIYPILKENHFTCPIIAYSGALILDEDRKVLYSDDFEKETAVRVIDFIEENQMDCTWNIYTIPYRTDPACPAEAGVTGCSPGIEDTWIVKDKTDPRVVREENIVHAYAAEGTAADLPEGARIGKILCMCSPDRILDIEERLKAEFPELSIVRSSGILLEIMQMGVTKQSAVEKLCGLWKIPLHSTVAFGDHYNDVEMLETAAMPFLMGNAPEELKNRFSNITDSNDEEGIWHALLKIGLVKELPPK